jgi:gamma-glutamylcyclotransferase (GGCT)/AIG2-like uncharacterized protein YtfP
LINYFAYGSNLDEAQMSRRCPNSRIISPGRLEGYRLAFTTYSTNWACGVADVVKSKGSEVWGLFYQLTEADLRNLDQCEGYPYKYTRFKVTVPTPVGPLNHVWVYSVKKKESFIPSPTYLGILRQVAVKYQFPESYLRQLDTILMEAKKLFKEEAIPAEEAQ